MSENNTFSCVVWTFSLTSYHKATISGESIAKQVFQSGLCRCKPEVLYNAVFSVCCLSETQNFHLSAVLAFCPVCSWILGPPKDSAPYFGPCVENRRNPPGKVIGYPFSSVYSLTPEATSTATDQSSEAFLCGSNIQ